MEAIDVSAGEYPDAYALSGERVRVSVDGEPETGEVVYVRTGEMALDELESRVRAYVEGARLPIDDTGDLLIDVANGLISADWDARWPKRPKWLARRLHGDAPPRFARP
jgi:hypothetical protein